MEQAYSAEKFAQLYRDAQAKNQRRREFFPTEPKEALRCPMDNSGQSLLQAPGFGDVPLDFQLPAEERYAHGIKDWRQTPTIAEHEISMVGVMNMITDFPDWHEDIVRDDRDLEQAWREQTRQMFLNVSDCAWKWCLRELRDKAADFRHTGAVRVLDIGSSVFKLDGRLLREIQQGLSSSSQHLFAKSRRKSHPEGVDVVDPHLYPLVYGLTPVFQQHGLTTLSNPFGSGPALPAPEQGLGQYDKNAREVALHELRLGVTCYDGFSLTFHGEISVLSDPDRTSGFHWSPRFQSLPCEVEAGDEADTVRITSYINNLHPRHASIYKLIERLIAEAIEPWNQSLIRGKVVPWTERDDYCSGRQQCGRIPARIPTFGRAWINDVPVCAYSFRNISSHPARSPSESLRQHDPFQPGGGPPKCVSEIQLAPSTRASTIRWDVPPDYVHRDIQETFNMTGEKGLRLVTDIPATPIPEAWKWAEQYLQLPVTRWEEEASKRNPPNLPDRWLDDPWACIAYKALVRRDSFLHPSTILPDPGLMLSYEDWRRGQYSNPLMAPGYMLPLDEFAIPRDINSNQKASKRTVKQRLCGPIFQGAIPSKDTGVHLQDFLHSSGLQVIIRIGEISVMPHQPQLEPSD